MPDRLARTKVMIGQEYCVMMSRYNAWQNQQLHDLLLDVDHDILIMDRKAFFGSILETLSHILWGDHMWISRFDGGAAPTGGIPDSSGLHGTLGAWHAGRSKMDARIHQWAETVEDVDLQGDLTWFSGAIGQQISKPMAMCVVHMFNHQTHHRGQIHAMMTSADLGGTVSDLAFMPEDV